LSHTDLPSVDDGRHLVSADLKQHRRMAGSIWMLLKKSATLYIARFSWVALPLAKARERRIGRSERSIFWPLAGEPTAATFSTASVVVRPLEPLFTVGVNVPSWPNPV
jgi:hypothetical protein